MTTVREESTRLAELLKREHLAMADFLVALAAFDETSDWIELGYTSLFYFLVRELGLPKGPVRARAPGSGVRTAGPGSSGRTACTPGGPDRAAG